MCCFISLFTSSIRRRYYECTLLELTVVVDFQSPTKILHANTKEYSHIILMHFPWKCIVENLEDLLSKFCDPPCTGDRKLPKSYMLSIHRKPWRIHNEGCWSPAKAIHLHFQEHPDYPVIRTFFAMMCLSMCRLL